MFWAQLTPGNAAFSGFAFAANNKQRCDLNAIPPEQSSPRNESLVSCGLFDLRATTACYLFARVRRLAPTQETSRFSGQITQCLVYFFVCCSEKIACIYLRGIEKSAAFSIPPITFRQIESRYGNCFHCVKQHTKAPKQLLESFILWKTHKTMNASLLNFAASTKRIHIPFLVISVAKTLEFLPAPPRLILRRTESVISIVKLFY